MQKSLLVLLAAASLTAGAQQASDVLVTRGGVSVTVQDVDSFVERVPKEQRGKFIDSPARIRDLLNNMLLTKQLAAQARADHLDQRPDVASQLRASQDEILSRARMADYMDNIKVPDLKELVSEQYLTHKSDYKLPASADVRHVLIATEKHSDDEAKALADQVHAEALANPKGFEALVDKYSEDTSKAENHGLIADATSEKYVQEFRDGAAALKKVGEVSPVVHTKYGYHVMVLVAKRPEHQQTLDEVRGKLTEQLRDEYITTQRRDLVNQLTNEKMDFNPATVDALRDRYDEAGNVRVATTPGKGGTPPATP
jgi:parvulin-like peptidyl-prolyl isomerase